MSRTHALAFDPVGVVVPDDAEDARHLKPVRVAAGDGGDHLARGLIALQRLSRNGGPSGPALPPAAGAVTVLGLLSSVLRPPSSALRAAR